MRIGTRLTTLALLSLLALLSVPARAEVTVGFAKTGSHGDTTTISMVVPVAADSFNTAAVTLCFPKTASGSGASYVPGSLKAGAVVLQASKGPWLFQVPNPAGHPAPPPPAEALAVCAPGPGIRMAGPGSILSFRLVGRGAVWVYATEFAAGGLLVPSRAPGWIELP